MGKGVIEVLATSGDSQLGGEDFDRKIVEHLLAQFQEKEGVSLRGDTMALQRLKDAAEKAKCDLSQLQSTEINLPFIAADAEENALHMSVLPPARSSRSSWALAERPSRSQRRSTTPLTVKQIDQVLLVGGQTRMPSRSWSLSARRPTRASTRRGGRGRRGDPAAMLSEEKEGPPSSTHPPLSGTRPLRRALPPS
jgi:molecular chaperone DnaK